MPDLITVLLSLVTISVALFYVALLWLAFEIVALLFLHIQRHYLSFKYWHVHTEWGKYTTHQDEPNLTQLHSLFSWQGLVYTYQCSGKVTKTTHYFLDCTVQPSKVLLFK